MLEKKSGLPLKLLLQFVYADVGIPDLTHIFHKTLVRYFKDFFS